MKKLSVGGIVPVWKADWPPVRKPPPPPSFAMIVPMPQQNHGEQVSIEQFDFLEYLRGKVVVAARNHDDSVALANVKREALSRATEQLDQALSLWRNGLLGESAELLKFVDQQTEKALG